MPQPGALMQQGPPTPPAVPPGPQSAPMAQPTPNEGKIQLGKVKVESAQSMLAAAIPDLGAGSPEASAVIKAMSALSKVFGDSKTSELVPAQIKELNRAAGPSPIGGMLAGGGAAPPPGGAPGVQ